MGLNVDQAPVGAHGTIMGVSRPSLRLVAALAGAVFVAAVDYYGYVDVEPPGGRSFWYGSTVGALLTPAIIVIVGALVARWWAPLIALAILVEQAWLAIRDVSGDFHDAYPPLEDPFLPFEILFVMLILAVGVSSSRGLSAVVRRLRAKR